MYQVIQHELSNLTRNAFSAKPWLIEKGILFQGKLERFFGITSGIIGRFWGRNRDRLFGCEDLESQRRFLAEKWDSYFWKFLGHMMCRRAFLVIFVDDPGFMNYLPEDMVIHRRVFECLGRYLQNNLARDNPLLSLIFYGRYCSEHCMPLYLRKDYFYRIKSALENTKVRIITGLIGDVLKETPDSTFDGFSLSDIASYMSKDTLDSHLGEVIRTAQKGAKICLRHCFAKREPSNTHAARIRHDTKLEAHFALHDHAMIHEFTIDEIV